MNTEPEYKSTINNPYDALPSDYDPSLNYIGGWLVLIVIGQFLGIILNIIDISKSSGYIGLSPKFDYLFVLTIVFSLISLIFCVATLVLIFKKNIIFRILFIIRFVIVFLFTIFALISLNDLGINASRVSLNFIESLAEYAIWITYVFKSKRVKNTFIYPKIYPSSQYDEDMMD